MFRSMADNEWQQPPCVHWHLHVLGKGYLLLRRHDPTSLIQDTQVDAYPTFAASALAANVFIRCIFAGKHTRDDHFCFMTTLTRPPCSGLPPVRRANVRGARLPVGHVAAGFPDTGHGALPLDLLEVRAQDTSAQQILQKLLSPSDVGRQGAGWLRLGRNPGPTHYSPCKLYEDLDSVFG